MSKLSEKMKKGFFATADFWKEQAFGKLVKYKRDWKRYYELSKLDNHCAFCEKFIIDTMFALRDCSECPLKDCGKNGWFEWAHSHNFIIRRIGAIRLWFKIKKWMKVNLPEYFNKE